jgi:putative heme-binding domain-containing protein
LSRLTEANGSNTTESGAAIDRLLSSTREAFMLARMLTREPAVANLRTEILAHAVAHPDPNVRDLFERFLPPSQRTRRLGDTIDRYKREELLESLIEPSTKVDPKFATHLLLTSSGKTYTGILVDKSDRQVTLNVLNGTVSEVVQIPLSEVEQLVPQKASLMPERMLRDLTAQQAADLLEFLSTLK